MTARVYALPQGLERVALTCSQYCTVSFQFFAEKRLHILRNCSKVYSKQFQNCVFRDSKLLLPMSTSETIESIQATLQPLEELQGEQTQLEAWVHDSFSALEKLHEELSEWQTELARKQTEIDLREDALEKCQEHEIDLDTHAAQWKRDLAEAREEIQQLEEENTEQLQELERLERGHDLLEAELKLARQSIEDLSVALEAERGRVSQEHSQWASEFQKIRRLVEKQGLLLEEHLGEEKLSAAPSEEAAVASSVEGDISSRSAEFRRRAQSRQAAKRRRRRNTEEPDQV